ncbi:MAG: DUF389 domain-containing protein [Acidimicrobiales bacterium]|nr:DUF389 domain-containing protein [Acidimicrobiales bacterium]
MIHLSVFVPPDLVDGVRHALAVTPGVAHVVAGASTEDGLVSVVAQVEPDATDAVIDALSAFELPLRDVTFWRVPSIHPLGWRRGRATADPDSQVWAEVVSRADDNSQLLVSYVLFMIAAGVVAGVGVLTGSSILVVGAMALSPDLLPISASAIGIVERRWQLAARAIRALCFGLAIGAMASCAATALLRVFNRIPEDLVLAETVLGPSLTKLGPGSILVAVAAGMASMVAFERAAGAAVGVAISVTTIPAAAYVGAAIALGRDEPMWGALLVLVTNVVLIILASTATLWVERWNRRRRAERVDATVGRSA